MQIPLEVGIPVTDSVSISDIPMLERARLACNTIKALFEQGVAEISEEEKEQAREAFQSFTENKGSRAPSMSVLAGYPNASLVYLDRMLSEYDHELVNSAVRIREYTKNKLLVESENPDPKIRIRALELLGKMKDVGLFTDRIEVTHRTKTDAELEEELGKKLERFMGSALVVDNTGGLEDDEPANGSLAEEKNADLNDAERLLDDLLQK